mmetsp:Transcript_11830/g.41427  ORF Transcript_11830/g.41427 Transcript_11830/m.41427 type:complete len:321 (+) Transcript_11830:2654-3616(+)
MSRHPLRRRGKPPPPRRRSAVGALPPAVRPPPAPAPASAAASAASAPLPPLPPATLVRDGRTSASIATSPPAAAFEPPAALSLPLCVSRAVTPSCARAVAASASDSGGDGRRRFDDGSPPLSAKSPSARPCGGVTGARGVSIIPGIDSLTTNTLPPGKRPSARTGRCTHAVPRNYRLVVPPTHSPKWLAAFLDPPLRPGARARDAEASASDPAPVAAPQANATPPTMRAPARASLQRRRAHTRNRPRRTRTPRARQPRSGAAPPPRSPSPRENADIDLLRLRAAPWPRRPGGKAALSLPRLLPELRASTAIDLRSTPVRV